MKRKKLFLLIAVLLLASTALVQTTDFTVMRNKTQTMTGVNTFSGATIFNGITDHADSSSDNVPVPTSGGAYNYYNLPTGCVGYRKVSGGGPAFFKCGADDLSDGTTGTGAVVRAANPTITGTATFGSGAGGILAGIMVAWPEPVTYATLNAAYPCGSTTKGYHGTVTDSTTNTWGATVAGTGGNVVGVFCNGTNWTVEAK